MSIELMQSTQISNLDFLWLEITPRCNLHCQHCYVESSPILTDPMIVDWPSMLEQAFDLGCRMVQFIGGEPMYNPRLKDYVSNAGNLGFDFIEIYSNLTMINSEMLDTFSDCNAHIATSFYSLHNETHDRITGVKGSFEKTIRGIDKVVARGLPLRVGIVVMQANEADIEQTIEFLVRRGVSRSEIKTDRSRPVGRGTDLTPPASLEETLCGKCWQGKLCITPRGSCYPCVFARHLEVGDVSSQPLADVVDSQKLLNTRNSLYRAFWPKLADCVPNCDPTCGPNRPCNPVCGPSCNPSCSPYADCRPSCTPQL
jgi:MoaA/NifB/PqqE/SkfB family radical SAM enzyme